MSVRLPKDGQMMSSMHMGTAHDTTTGAPWFMKHGASADGTPTAVETDRFVAEEWEITNQTDVQVDLFIHGKWAPNYDGNFTLTSPFTNMLLVQLAVGETFRGPRGFALHGVTNSSTIASGFVRVIGWNK